MRLIDADTLFEYIQKEKAWKQDTICHPRYDKGKYDAYYEMLEIIKRRPTVKVTLTVHAHWIFNTDDFSPAYRCSHCGKNVPCIANETPVKSRTKYCPFCGAIMDEDKEENKKNEN